eukprot:GHVP01000576.1.p2 GENE.GHVP01000576.1~~GHVP01000576.1.p2  ORF type:complete len:428 (-),score=72.38 GHVP01000576.1:423-1706(-)
MRTEITEARKLIFTDLIEDVDEIRIEADESEGIITKSKQKKVSYAVFVESEEEIDSWDDDSNVETKLEIDQMSISDAIYSLDSLNTLKEDICSEDDESYKKELNENGDEFYSFHGKEAERIIFMCYDQNGSRVLQSIITDGAFSEKNRIFDIIKVDIVNLIDNVFGNYVIQRFCEWGTIDQRLFIIQNVLERFVTFSCNAYGSRIVQKILQISSVTGEAGVTLDDMFIVTKNDLFKLSCDPYGCRVLQKMIEDGLGKNDMFMKELKIFMKDLIMDKYGNYVIQHVLKYGSPMNKEEVHKVILENLSVFSKHKFSSNVVERVIVSGTGEQKMALIGQMIMNGNDVFYGLISDQYGNYVLQKALGVFNIIQISPDMICRNKISEYTRRIVELVGTYIEDLKQYIYGRNIINKKIQIEKEIPNIYVNKLV